MCVPCFKFQFLFDPTGLVAEDALIVAAEEVKVLRVVPGLAHGQFNAISSFSTQLSIVLQHEMVTCLVILLQQCVVTLLTSLNSWMHIQILFHL